MTDRQTDTRGNTICLSTLKGEDISNAFMKLERNQVLNVCLFCLFVLLLYIPVNSYGHGGTVSSPNHTFSLASLNKQLTNNLFTYFRL